MIKIEEILKAKTSKEIKNNIYKKLENQISEIKAEYEYVFETEDELISFIKKGLDECINNYEEDYEEFELYFLNKIKEAIKTFLKIQLEKQHFKVVDNYINYLSKNKIDDNYKYIYLLSEFASCATEEARFNLILYLISNPDVLLVLDSIAKKDKIKVVDIPKVYRNDILVNILETYCNDKEKEFVDISVDDSDTKIDDSTRAYLNEIRKIEILPKEKQMELAYQASLGDETAKQSLVNSNLRLVVPIAKKYQNKGLELIDLIQEGNIGLIKAIKLYDVSKGFAFSTYATWWIRQAVSRAVMDKGKTIRIPVHRYDKFRNFLQVKSRLTRELKREPSVIELAEELELSIEKVNELILSVCETTSLNTFIGDDEKSELIDFIKDEENLEDDVMSSVNTKELFSLLKTTLTKKQFDIVCLRLGLTDGRKWTLEELGRKYNVTRERIRQIEAKAYRRMRALRETKDFMDKKESKNITTSKKDYTFEERAEIFLEEQDLSKYKDNKIKFKDNMSMCSWFNYNKYKIFESTIDTCIKIKNQYTCYINRKEEKQMTNNEQERLDEQRPGFYLEFPNYEINDINKAFGMLSEKQKEIILTRHNGSLTLPKSVSLKSQSEYNLYWAAKNRIQQLIENGFKKRTRSKKETNEAKKDEVQKIKLNENNEEKNKNLNQTQIIDELTEADLNSRKVDETQKNETKENIDNKQVNQESVKEISTDVNEAYLKLYELLSLPCFTNLMINKKYYDVMFIKMKFPNKSIKEISDFTGLSEKEITSFLLDGIDELMLKIEVMLKEMLAEYKPETSKTTGSYVKKDNM